MSNVETLLRRNKPRFGGAEIFALLLPILIKIFEGLMEQCANTENEAIDLICYPDPTQMRIMRWRLRNEMRRADGINLRPRERRVAANQIMSDVIQAANSDPELVGAVFADVKVRDSF